MKKKTKMMKRWQNDDGGTTSIYKISQRFVIKSSKFRWKRNAERKEQINQNIKHPLKQICGYLSRLLFGGSPWEMEFAKKEEYYLPSYLKQDNANGHGAKPWVGYITSILPKGYLIYLKGKIGKLKNHQT